MPDTLAPLTNAATPADAHLDIQGSTELATARFQAEQARALLIAHGRNLQQHRVFARYLAEPARAIALEHIDAALASLRGHLPAGLTLPLGGGEGEAVPA